MKTVVIFLLGLVLNLSLKAQTDSVVFFEEWEEGFSVIHYSGDKATVIDFSESSNIIYSTITWQGKTGVNIYYPVNQERKVFQTPADNQLAVVKELSNLTMTLMDKNQWSKKLSNLKVAEGVLFFGMLKDSLELQKITKNPYLFTKKQKKEENIILTNLSLKTKERNAILADISSLENTMQKFQDIETELEYLEKLSPGQGAMYLLKKSFKQ